MRTGQIAVNAEDTISWANFGLVSTPALQPGAPRPTDRIGDRLLYMQCHE